MTNELETRRRSALLKELAKAQERIEEGLLQIAHQTRIVAQLEEDGLDSTSAAQLLEILEQYQTKHLSDCNRIRETLGE